MPKKHLNIQKSKEEKEQDVLNIRTIIREEIKYLISVKGSNSGYGHHDIQHLINALKLQISIDNIDTLQFQKVELDESDWTLEDHLLPGDEQDDLKRDHVQFLSFPKPPVKLNVSTKKNAHSWDNIFSESKRAATIGPYDLIAPELLHHVSKSPKSKTLMTDAYFMLGALKSNDHNKVELVDKLDIVIDTSEMLTQTDFNSLIDAISKKIMTVHNTNQINRCLSAIEQSQIESIVGYGKLESPPSLSANFKDELIDRNVDTKHYLRDYLLGLITYIVRHWPECDSDFSQYYKYIGIKKAGYERVKHDKDKSEMILTVDDAVHCVSTYLEEKQIPIKDAKFANSETIRKNHRFISSLISARLQ